MKIVIPFILSILGIAIFFGYTNKAQDEVKLLKGEVASYDEALNNSRQLQEVRDVLGEKYNSFSKEDIDRLNKMIPSNVSNIKLIIEISQIASKYGFVLRNVKYDTNEAKASTPSTNGELTDAERRNILENKPYGSFDLEFSTQGQYGNFLALLRDVEQNLRIVDIVGLKFTPADADSATQVKDNYKYDFKIRTYYLKN